MALWFVLEYMKKRNARAKAFRLGIVLMMRRLYEKASCMSLVPKVSWCDSNLQPTAHTQPTVEPRGVRILLISAQAAPGLLSKRGGSAHYLQRRASQLVPRVDRCSLLLARGLCWIMGLP